MHPKAALQLLQFFRAEIGWVGLPAFRHELLKLRLSRQTPTLPGLGGRKQGG